jgi:Lipocalin-like domain
MSKLKLGDLLGSWELQSYVETDVETGERNFPMGKKPRGLIIYTNDGYMSAQLCTDDRANFARADPYCALPVEYHKAGISYLAYSGPFFFDESKNRLEHEMFVSFFPNWRGQRQVRVATLEDGRLHLAPDQPMEFNGRLKTADLLWRRARRNLLP